MIHQLVLGKYQFGTAFAYGLEQAGLPYFYLIGLTHQSEVVMLICQGILS